MTASDERRDLGRLPSFSYVKLVTTDAGGNEKVLPMILRDRSGTGVGAMYIGKEVLNPAGTYILRDAEGTEKKVPTGVDSACGGLRPDVGSGDRRRLISRRS